MPSLVPAPIQNEAAACEAPRAAATGAVRSRSRLTGTIALAAALALTIFAVRVALVTMYARSVPFYDEWGATVSFLAHGEAEGTIGILSLMHPSNEHTILFSRLLALIEFDLNQGQFDNVAATLVNALLFAVTWAFAAYLFLCRLPRSSSCVAVAMAVVLIAPLGWENILTGFQSQFAFLILGAVVNLWLAAGSRRMSRGNTIAFAVVSFAACPTMASGFFAPLFAAGICLLRASREPESRRPLLVRCGIAMAAVVFGIWLFLRAPHTYAKGDFGHVIQVLLSYFGWPYSFSPLVGVLASVPFIVFSARFLRKAVSQPLDYFALALGLWSAAQIAALALGRQTFGGISASRYLDVVLFWPMMNLYALARLADGPTRPRWHLAARAASIAACAVFIGFVVGKVGPTLDDIKARSVNYSTHTWRIARYLRFGDESVLKTTAFLALPYPGGAVLKGFLDDPLVRDAMPAEVRVPLDVEPEPAADAQTFATEGAGPLVAKYRDLPFYGSFNAGKESAVGQFRSRPLSTRFPYLAMEVSGGPASDKLELRFACEPASACPAQDVAGGRLSPRAWQQVLVTSPPGPFRVVAADNSTSAWLAFTAPRELGRLSYLATALTTWLKDVPYRFIAAVSALVACLALLGWATRYGAHADSEEESACT